MSLPITALTTYATMKSELNLPDDTRRSVVERMIASSSASIYQIANREFHFVPGRVESIPARGGFRLVVANPPIRTLSAIQLLSPDGTVAYTYDPTTYLIENKNAGIIYRTTGSYGLTGATGLSPTNIYGRDLGWPNLGQPGDDIMSSPMPTTERPGLSVRYDSGWITPQQDLASDGVTAIGNRDLPYDLEEACILGVVSQWTKRGRNRDVQSETMNTGISVTYRAPNVSTLTGGFLPIEAERIALSYARFV